MAEPIGDLCASDAVPLAGLLRRGGVSAREVVTAHIKRIEAADPVVNASTTAATEGAGWVRPLKELSRS